VKRRAKYVVAGAVILGALGFLVFGGFREAVVYFVTPTELLAKGAGAPGAFRLGGMVKQGSVKWDAQSLLLAFEVTDGKATVRVRHKGAPPDLFGEGRGAVTEGQYGADGVFESRQILAKHSEEYHPPAQEATASQQQNLYKTLQQQGTTR
jgi:cytochrome c-type biogenesis protein CcmE